jgi:DNA glycosylase AlkZ-like
MDLSDIARERLANHGLTRVAWPDAAAAVAHMGALQAQDYSASLWAAGVRSGATRAEVEAAIATGALVRTWPMRGTLHMLAAADVRWMLELMAPRAIAKARGRTAQLEIDDEVLARAAALIERALAGGNRLTRRELYGLLNAAGMRPDGQRGIHILWQLAHRRLLCIGPRRGKDPTFVLLDDWVPPAPPLDRDEALVELAVRYFRSHGPATERDLAWWSGLTLSDIRRAIDVAATALESITVADTIYWRGRDTTVPSPDSHTVIFLPGFDEFVLGYTDRSVVLPRQHANRIVPGGNGVFRSTVVVDARVAGTWRKSAVGGRLIVSVEPFEALTARTRSALADPVSTYARFLDHDGPVELTIDDA